MIRACRQALFRWKIADSTGEELTGGQFLLKALILRRLLLREVLGAEERNVGILLPPTNGAAIVNAAVALMGRVAVNLNYSVSSKVLKQCIDKAKIKHVLTSRKVIDKLGLEIGSEVFFLEDLKTKLRLSDKLIGAALAYGCPAAILDRLLGLHKISLDETQTIIFTSGSTGEPKGVMLSGHNINCNVAAMDKVVHLRRSDVILGILPFFHSFGYTVTLWGPLSLDIQAAYHFSPLDARQVGKLAKERGATILLSTPTFLRTYLKRCEVEDFEKMEVVVAGAEKLPISLCDAFEKKFGVRPIEGYGATELSPLVSVNVPPSRSQTDEIDWREGTVGRPIPSVAARVVDPETGEPLPRNSTGMLQISGPNLMKGYLDEPTKTAEVIRDGWYVTGDIAFLDEEGFIHITGRESRFSKIGGEMVPHVRIEEEIQNFLAAGNEEVELFAAVTAIPDERKGERLVVVHAELPKSPAEISAHLAAIGLPNLWIPSNDSYVQVAEMPILGSGKLDLKLLAKIAQDKLGE